METIEHLLERAGQQGLSTKCLISQTGLSKRKVLFYIFHSKNIEDCNPLIHGSGKRQIHVFVYNPNKHSYKVRKEMLKRHLRKQKVVEEPVITEPPPKVVVEDFEKDYIMVNKLK